MWDIPARGEGCGERLRQVGKRLLDVARDLPQLGLRRAALPEGHHRTRAATHPNAPLATTFWISAESVTHELSSVAAMSFLTAASGITNGQMSMLLSSHTAGPFMLALKVV